MKKYILIVFMLLIAKLYSQERTINIGNINIDETNSKITSRPNGNFILASGAGVTGGTKDIQVAEYNNIGKEIWARQFSIPGTNEVPVDIMLYNGDIYILAYRQGLMHPLSNLSSRTHTLLYRIDGTNSSHALVFIRQFEPTGLVQFNIDYILTPISMVVNYSVSPAEISITSNYGILSPGLSSSTVDQTILNVNPLNGNLNSQFSFDIQGGNANIRGARTDVLVATTNLTLFAGGVNSNYQNHGLLLYTRSTNVSTGVVLNQRCVSYGINDQIRLRNNGVIDFTQKRSNGTIIGVGMHNDYVGGQAGANAPYGNSRLFIAEIQYDQADSRYEITNNQIRSYYIGNAATDLNHYQVRSTTLLDDNTLLLAGDVMDVNPNGTNAASFQRYFYMAVNLINYSVIYYYEQNSPVNEFNGASDVYYNNSNNRIYISGNFRNPVQLDSRVLIGASGMEITSNCIENSEMLFEIIPLTAPSLEFLIFTPDQLATDIQVNADSVSTTSNIACQSCEEYSNYLHIADGTRITTNTVWGTLGDGVKYYIDGELTIENATLDITNCDIVFSECGSIRFNGNNAMLRANNSVFRPCNEARKWQGIRITGGLHHRVMECLFKNAQAAIRLTGEGVGFDQIVRNTFVNNYISIDIQNATINGAITGNHFEVNSPVLTYLNQFCSAIPGATQQQFYGIKSMNSIFNSPISNNEFVADDPLSSSLKDWEYKGIEFLQCAGVIEYNKFTNNTVAIAQTGNNVAVPNYVNKIEGNEINLNRNFGNPMRQVSVVSNVAGTINSLITNNKISNNRRLPNSISNFSAIYSESTNNAIIEQNEIRGFDIGINVANAFNSTISLNTINGSYKIGIYNYANTGTLISCNKIDMQFSNTSTQSVGIKTYGCDQFVSPGANPSRIWSNCVFNTETALSIEGVIPNPLIVSAPSSLPSIRNNYFYNYLQNGIFIGQNTIFGNIGTTSLPGMNTFARNSLAGFDITNTTSSSLPTALNFYPQSMSFSGPVGVSNFTANQHSVASCGQQVAGQGANINGKITEEFKCDPFGVNIMNPAGATGTGNGQFVIQPGKSLSDFLNSQSMLFTAANAFGASKKAIFISELENLRNSSKMENDLFEKLMTTYFSAAQDWNQAILHLERVSKGSNENAVGIELQKAIINTRIGNSSVDSSKKLLIWVNEILARKDINYNLAAYFKSLLTGEASFQLPPVPDFVLPSKNHNTTLLQSEQSEVLVYPNPANSNIHVKVVAGYDVKESSSTVIELLNLNGSVLKKVESEIGIGLIDLNVGDLPKGLYFVKVKFSDDSMRVQKLIIE